MEIALDHYFQKLLQQINKALKNSCWDSGQKFSSLHIQYGLEEKSKYSERTELQDKDSLPWSVQKNRSLEHFDCFAPINKSWKKKRIFYAKWNCPHDWNQLLPKNVKMCSMNNLWETFQRKTWKQKLTLHQFAEKEYVTWQQPVTRKWDKLIQKICSCLSLNLREF